MKIIKLSVQEFAEPSPRRGSIEPGGQGFTTLEMGQLLHKKVQAEKIAEVPDYQTEVPIKCTFKTESYHFEVSGRMDGFIPGEKPRIEEIKSAFNIFDLAKNIKDKRFDHPYYLQLLTYGYMYWKEYNVKPELGFELISSRREETYAFDAYWDYKEFELWLERRLNDLVDEAKRAEKRFERRKKTSLKLPFPFPTPRKGQMELIEFIEQGFLEKKKLLLQAPTGLGKTIGVLYPALKESLNRGQRVVYLTPKNSQQAIATEAVEKMQVKGCSSRSIALTSKAKLCMKAEPLCNPEYCEFARDYYDKLTTFNIKDELLKKKKITSRVMKNLATKYEVCPFELQLEALDEMDVVICDYNYVFGHQSILGKLSSVSFEQAGKPNLVIDEAHNLPARTMGNFSPSLSTGYLEGLRSGFEGLPKKFRKDGIELLSACIETVEDLAPKEKESKLIPFLIENFISVNDELKAFLSVYLESDVEIKSGDPVLKLVFYWGDFTETLMQIENDQDQFFTTAQNDGKNKTIKITCCDASALIKNRYDHFEQHVLFSATLKPFDYYRKLSGIEEGEVIESEFSSPFSPQNRKVMIIPQISTKYSQRVRNYPRIAETINRVVQLKAGNYLAFFPSFDFMENVFRLFSPPPGTEVIKQKRFMKNDDVEGILDSLKESGKPQILFAVQGGVFSEGIDYAGDMVIGAFVVGPPLPGFDFEREKMKSYYQEKYAQGFDYAYTFPAMARAVQSAGRVIRTEEDRGIIILMDDRFLEESYGQSLPRDWFMASPRELVSEKILTDLKQFWEQALPMSQLLSSHHGPVDCQEHNCPKD